jgi:hypothetical protein
MRPFVGYASFCARSSSHSIEAIVGEFRSATISAPMPPPAMSLAIIRLPSVAVIRSVAVAIAIRSIAIAIALIGAAIRFAEAILKCKSLSTRVCGLRKLRGA